ncbi:MAG: rRNA maturation RNase YbeY [Holosporales bacterium]
MQLEVDVAILSGPWPQELETYIQKVVMTTLSHVAPDASALEVSVVLADDATVQDLNHRYRNKNKPTNVLSFPGQELHPDDLKGLQDLHLGDVILAFETVTKEAATEGKSFADHMAHLVVHGILHLLGYDHEHEEEAHVMEGLEIEILRHLEISNPYLVMEDR